MSPDILAASKLLAALGSALMAGLFFAFSVAVMRALGRLPVPQGIAAMQAINRAILNPVFFVVFFGTAAACVAVAIAALLDWPALGTDWLLAGSLLYLVCGLLVTLLFNVPLNNALAKAEPESDEAARLWARYLSRWTAWNHLRTVGTLAATAGLMMGLR